MSRMNNTSASLRIISKQNGWDPDVIEGHGSIAPIYHERETPSSGDTSGIVPEMADPNASPPGTTEMHAPVPGPQGRSRRTVNANPYPGMPGS